MVALLAIVACGSDDPEEPAKSGVDTQVVGTWTYVENDEDESVSQTLVLKANGTFTLEGVLVLKDAEDIAEEGFTKQEAKAEGNYTTVNNKLTMVPTKGSVRYDGKQWQDASDIMEEDAWTYAVSGNKLTVIDGDGDEMVYTKIQHE